MRAAKSRLAFARKAILLACYSLLFACSGSSPKLDSRIFGHWRTVKVEELSSGEKFYTVYAISKDGMNGKIDKHRDFISTDRPFLDAVLGDQTFSIKPHSEGIVEQDNIDGNIISIVGCWIIDCAHLVSYEVSSDGVLIFYKGETEEIRLEKF